jgi:hypothetical protein
LETKYKYYNHGDSFERIDEILDESDTSFPKINEIPARDKLTYKNGFYVNCSPHVNLIQPLTSSQQIQDTQISAV